MLDQSGVPAALLRRWFLLPLGALITLGLCLAASSAVPVQHRLTARVLLLPASSPAKPGEPPVNPYLSLGGLGPAASVVARSLASAESTADLIDLGAKGTFSVGPDFGTDGPVLLVTAEAESPETAKTTLDLVVARVPLMLKQLQQNVGVPQSALIGSTIISRDPSPEVVRKSQVRAVLVAAAAGIGSTGLGIVLLDAVLRRPRRVPEGRSRRSMPISGSPDHVVQQLPTRGDGPRMLGAPESYRARSGTEHEM